MAKISKLLIVVLVVVCISAGLSSMPLSNASAIEAEAAYGGTYYIVCDDFQPCPGPNTPTPILVHCYEKNDYCKVAGHHTTCGSVEQGIEYYAYKCKTLVDYTPPWEEDQCFFKENEKRWFYSHRCRCDEPQQICYDSEEVIYCSEQQEYYECYIEQQP